MGQQASKMKMPKAASRGKTAKSPSKGKAAKSTSKGKAAKSPSGKMTAKSPSKTKSKSPSVVQTSPGLGSGGKTSPALQPSKSPKAKTVSSLTDFFGSAPIKRSQPLTKPTAKRKETVKVVCVCACVCVRARLCGQMVMPFCLALQKTEVITIPESPADSPRDCLEDDLGLDEAEISQVLDDIEKEMEGGGSQQEKGGVSQQEEGGGAQQENGVLARDRKRAHEKEGEEEKDATADAASRVPRTPPVKKLRRAVEAAQAGKQSVEGSSTPQQQVKAKTVGRSPQTPRAGVGTPTSPEKGSTPTLNRGASYRAYLQRSGPAHPGSKPIPEGKPNCLSGLTFVITGELDSLYRDQAASLIQSSGGRVTGSISKKTSHVLVGREAGESKLAKVGGAQCGWLVCRGLREFL